MSNLPFQVSARRLGCLALAVILSGITAMPAHAVLATFTSTGVYDEAVTANAVDVFALGNNVGGVVGTPTSTQAELMAGYEQFKLDIQAAFNQNKGGVISFDNDANPVAAGDPEFVALIGANQSNLMTVRRPDGTLNNNSNHPVISGTNYLGMTSASPNTLEFSPFTLRTFAITALGRAANRTTQLNIIYADDTPQTPSRVAFPLENLGPENTGDLFFGWTAPAGKTIKAVTFINNQFIRYDDMAVILADFQPGDVDGDLDVDNIDYNIIRSNFGKTPAAKAEGDVTLDGIVDIRDFQLWKANDGLAATGAVTAIPEPSGVALAAIGILAAARRRRRR